MESYEVSNGVMIIYLPKELDHYAAEKLKKKTQKVFDTERIMHLIFDFERTEFMDSSGIGLITGRFRRVYDNGGNVYVVNVSNGIDKVLLMSGIYRIVTRKETKEDIIGELLEGGYHE